MLRFFNFSLFLCCLFASNLTFSQDVNRTGSDHILNSSINAFVASNSSSTLGFIVLPGSSTGDVDVVILVQGANNFDPVLSVRFDSSTSTIVARNDDWGSTSLTNFPNNNAARIARDCVLNTWGFRNRLGFRDALVVVSVPTGGSRSVLAEVTGFNGSSGRANLQILQMDGPVSGCPDF
jgi:hypothetical protein